jgi:hypothetical protein
MKPIIDYNSIAPRDSIIGMYMQMMDAQETPRAYDFWCAVWLLSLALGRETIVMRPRAPVHMNAYIVLAAEAGTTRKSTAVRIATTIGRQLIADSPHWQLVEGKTTPEKLEAMMHESTQLHGRTSLAISISEMVTFFGREKYNMNMPGLLTDLYDCPTQRIGGTVLRRREIKNAFVSILTASTPSWLVRAINPDVIEGGFTSRTLFIVEERSKRRIPWPEDGNATGTADQVLRQLRELREEAAKVRESCGGIGISEQARDDFSKWYISRDTDRESFASSFAAREDHHVLRLAGFLAANERGWIIQCQHIKKAIRLIEHCKHAAASLFTGSGSISRVALGIDRVRTNLVNAGTDGLTQSQLLQCVRGLMHSEHLGLTLKLMHELGMVQRFDAVAASGRGRPIVIWRATQKIVARNATDLIFSKIEPYAS